MHQIFISYRRDGGEAMAQLLHDRLTNKGFSVFYDIESLKSGPFDTKIYTKIEECDDFLLVLPAQSLDRCIYDEDWVRTEIRHALQNHKNIIPIIMRGFVFPDNLPEDISAVSRINGISFENMEYLDAKIERVISMLISKPLHNFKTNATQDTYTKSYRNNRKSPVIISNICAIGSNDMENCWPKGHYSQVINRDQYSVIYFHITVSNVPKDAKKIQSGFKIYNDNNMQIFEDVTDFSWESDYDRVARSWIIKGSDGSFVPTGTYKAEFWIDDSIVHEYFFEVTANQKTKRWFFQKR